MYGYICFPRLCGFCTSLTSPSDSKPSRCCKCKSLGCHWWFIRLIAPSFIIFHVLHLSRHLPPLLIWLFRCSSSIAAGEWFWQQMFLNLPKQFLNPFVLPRFDSPTPHHSSHLSSGDHRSRILPQWCITGAIGCSFYVYITYITDSFIFCSIAVFLKKRS